VLQRRRFLFQVNTSRAGCVRMDCRAARQITMLAAMEDGLDENDHGSL
jgi:hypothetical protein